MNDHVDTLQKKTSTPKEVLITTVIVVSLLSLLFRFRSISFVHELLPALTALILIGATLLRSPKHLGMIPYLDRSWRECRQSLITFLLFSIAIFIPLLLGNHIYKTEFFNASYRPLSHAAYVKLGLHALTQLVLVALPEEFFFRGYVQDGLNAAYPKRWRILGASCGVGWIYTAALFAISHSAITIRWWHAFIFFPGLAFGWLREKTGTLLAPILFHALANTFSYWVFLSYRK